MKMKSIRQTQFARVLAATTALAGMACPDMALAANDAAAPAAAPVAAPASASAPDQATDTGLGDIIVTATRTAESIQRVPISIQAFTAQALADREVQGLGDIAELLPSVSIDGLGPGRQTIYFRGIVPAGGLVYASAGYYLDDIPISGTETPEIHPYDIERVEALSGPQGTLYGAGSLAGTIRFITNKPKLDKMEFGYEIQGDKYGDGNFGGLLQSYVNLPVNDTIAVRAMGYYRHDGGYIDNTPNNGKFNDGTPSVLTLGDNNPLTNYTLNNAAIAKNNYNPVYEYGGRVAMLWEIAPGWQITPEVTAQRQIAYGYFGYDPKVGDLQVHDYDLTRQDDKWLQAQMTIHGHIGDFDVVSASGFYARKTLLRNDYTYYTVTYDKIAQNNNPPGGYESYLQFFDKKGCTGSGATLKCTTFINPTQYFHADTNDHKYTQELRVTTPKTWPFDLTLGGFFQDQKIETNDFYAIHGLDNVEGYTEAGGGNNEALLGVPTQYGGTMVLGSPAVKGDGYYVVENNRTLHDEAIFTEAHYNILPTVKLTGGVRYFFTDSEFKGFSGTMPSATNTTTSLYVPTGTYGCPTPLPAARLTCLDSNFAAPDEVGRYKERGETHKAAINWQITPADMAYFNYSTGFRPGGFNRPLRIRDVGVATVPPYESETLTNFEVGIKTTYHNIFRFNAAAYIEDWNNIQYGVVVAGAQGAGITGNAGKARVKGVEYDADLRLGAFTIATNGAFNDAKLNGNFCNFQYSNGSITQLSTCTAGQFIPGNLTISQVAAANGTRLPRQPKYKGTASVRYDTDMGQLKGYLMASALYQTSTTQNLNVHDNNLLVCPNLEDASVAATGVGLTSACADPGFVSFNFSAGIKKANWHADLFIENAFDRRGILTQNTFCSIAECSGSARNFPNKPQYFGFKFGQDF